MNLLSKKDDLLNKMFLITKEAESFLSDDSFDDYDKINAIFDERNKIILEINSIDEQLKNSESSSGDENIIKSIEITLNGIAAIDERIEELAEKQFLELSKDIKSINDGKKGLGFNRDESIAGVNLDVSQ